MGRIFQRKNRKGYYLQVAVPRELRKELKTTSIVRKLSNNKSESFSMKKEIEEKIKKELRDLKNKNLLDKKESYKDEYDMRIDNLYMKFNHEYFQKNLVLNEKAMVLSYWHCIGHEADFKEKNSYQIVKFFNLEIIIHNYKGNLWAIENSCPHRGTKFFNTNRGNSKITCPYHGWTFTPDKAFIPRKDTFKDEKLINDARPKEWKIRNINGLIFISYKPLFSIQEQLGDEVFQIICLIGESIYQNYSSQDIVFDSNWKIAIENALEPYHISMVHKNTLAPLGISNGQNKLYDWASIFHDKIKSSKLKKTKRLFEKMLKIKFDFEGYWSLYLFPFSMISSTEATTFAHQLYQPSPKLDSTICLTKLWCMEPNNKKYDESLKCFYKSVSETNLQIFKEDAEICSQINIESWNEKPLNFESTLEIKINHFRNCLRKSDKLVN
ncbi:aromatic ring-hydroxylating dioxygenase subunit alpha [uncultured Prochlorococcus sp.]|uniref:aromatic ring-hydroxylating oxygenase subunit alpha n=1 Tax=uncultured Prochlorococcus sp. TaxID=159733 RepID=UPI0025835182|nr:Rieske 2Fe-2S domain-containing protein [uncultured Prochlorococcus sp.]